MTSTGVSEALRDELEKALPPDRVIGESAALDRAARSTTPFPRRPCLIVRPTTTGEVAAIVRIAARHGASVHPVSAGRNWGYSDACAPVEGAILVDLSGMNRILEVNAELGYAVVEAGVTQGQLARHLRETGLPLRLDAVGSGPDASLVGNFLERGFGHGTYGERCGCACDLEIVLADGTVFRTGFGGYADARAASVHRWGIGPWLDGLFMQSNLGIVTRATIWLAPEPGAAAYFVVSVEDEADGGLLLETLRDLKLQGTARSTMHVFNDMRLLGTATRRPEDVPRTVPLDVADPARTAAMKREFGVRAWAASGLLVATTAAEVRAQRRAVKNALRRLPSLKLVFTIDDRWYKRIARLRAKVPRALGGLPPLRMWDQLAMGVDLLRGEMRYDTLKSALWRARGTGGPTFDPLEAGAGTVWVSPVLPSTREDLDRIGAIARPILASYGFEYGVTFSLVSDRASAAVISICFDRTDPEETTRAAAAHDALLEAFLENGYVPYRGTNRALEILRAANPAFWRVASRIKQSLDPGGVVSPGRYIGDCSAVSRGPEGGRDLQPGGA
ncbi:MAG: FAD-binding oxidoreductase [Acidobacteriota bacterium]